MILIILILLLTYIIFLIFASQFNFIYLIHYKNFLYSNIILIIKVHLIFHLINLFVMHYQLSFNLISYSHFYKVK